MGWMLDLDHEGYVVAVERVDDRWRELGWVDRGRGRVEVRHVQVACDCGWRSPRMVAPLGTYWSPCSVTLGEPGDGEVWDDAAFELWRGEHADDVCAESDQWLLRARQRELHRSQQRSRRLSS